MNGICSAQIFQPLNRSHTVGLNHAERCGDISSDVGRRIHYKFKRSDGFSLKDVPIKFRPFFTPLLLDPAFKGTVNGSVVLVDDLLAPGKTLGAAAALIRHLANI